jgi:protein-S-isoprenylcysteine O-methyltransferase Ste14
MKTKISVPMLLARWLFFVLIFAILIFVPAGTLDWPAGWVFLGVYVACSLSLGAWMLKNNPAYLEKRLEVEKSSGKTWDKILTLVMGVFFISIFIIAGLDVFHAHWSRVPSGAEAFGFAGVLLSLALVFLVMKENPYATRIVDVTKGQKVISSGPYSIVRHPMYVGAIVFYLSIPIALGSSYALFPAFCGAALFVFRTYMEDRTLQKELKGYREYTEKVRYRLIPGIW